MPETAAAPSPAPAADDIGDVSFRVAGMTCASCVSRVEHALSAVPGVQSAVVNLALEQATLRLDPQRVRRETLVDAVERAGYDIEFDRGPELKPAEAEREREARVARESQRQLLMLLGSALASLPLLLPMLLMAVGVDWHPSPWLQLALASVVQFWFGARFYRGAWAALRNLSGNMDLLVSLGTSAAYGYSAALVLAHGSSAGDKLYFEASALLITLVRFGKWLEHRATRATSAALRELMKLQPERAVVLEDGRQIEVDVERVRPLDVVVVRPGERIPVDGRVLAGESDTDESLVTGESLPVAKRPGSTVIAGSLNGRGSLEVSVTRVGKDSTLGRIVALVSSAQAGKAPVQRLVDRVSAVRAGGRRHRARHARRLACSGSGIRYGADRSGVRARHRLSLCARFGHPHGDRGGHGLGGSRGHSFQGHRGSGACMPARLRRVRQDGHADRRPSPGH
jgi:Cu+-exporting ATPase